MILQLLDDEECIPERELAHTWRIIDKLYTRDIYAWGQCKYCRYLRLFRYNAPRKRDSLYAATFDDVDGVITAVKLNTESPFTLEIKRRKKIEKIYLKRDEDVLNEVFKEVSE